MNENHPREVQPISPEWSIPQVAEALYRALSGEGPALAFAPVSTTTVAADIAVIIPTSGSTGAPKEVALSASALIASARASHKYLEAQSGNRWSLLLPTNHIAGVNVLVRALELGVQPVGIDEDAQFTAIVPTQLHRSLNGDAKLLHHLKNCTAVLVGGAATSDDLVGAARAEGINVVTTYGMSEMSGGCIYNNSPLAGVDVRISSAGAIQLKGPMMADGYLNNPGLWQSVTSDGWFTTSDLGELREGKLYVHGRSDDQIISGGEKISIGAIENLLHAEFIDQEFVAFGIPDLEWGTKLVIASNAEIDIERVRSITRSEFGAHAVPKEFITLEKLPLTSIGKPDRSAAREIYLAHE
jgi:o-succinylbenzoate---CoA ligase